MSGDDLSRGLGLVVRQVRSGQGLSQEQLADLAGLDRAYISGLERGVRNPTLKTLERLAGVLEVPLHDLIRRARELN